MPDDEGYLAAGELQVGGYAALEGDLGEKVCGPLGFTAPEVEYVEDDPDAFTPTGFCTSGGRVVFQVRGLG